MIKLNPCPDCGSDFIVPLYITPTDKKEKEYVYFCNKCHKVSQSARTMDKAAEHWNQLSAGKPDISNSKNNEAKK